jgi:formiminoglutamase
MMKRSKYCIIGIPDHQAVIGRLGARRGPEMFRKNWKRLLGKGFSVSDVKDWGDVSGLTPNIQKNHALASDAIQVAQSEHDRSVVIGGGHDHGYSHLLGVKRALEPKFKSRFKLACINIDAHFDVRAPQPTITSGSPFYLAIENQVLNPKFFVEFGIQSHCNAAALWDYVEKHQIQVVPMEALRKGCAVSRFKKELRRLARISDAVVVSFDLDSVAEAFAPGVSAPQSEGFSPQEILEMMEIAGREKKCVSLGIFELNPEHDQGERTARLAATAAFHFLNHTVV